MVDIHNHILFGVDDGPKTIEESIEMIEIGMRLGFDEFYLTSHYNKGNFNNKNYDKNYEILKEKCLELDLKVKLHKGNEVYLDENVSTVLKEKRFNVLKDNFILVEFSTLTTAEIAKKLIKKVIENGYIPILAHIERYRNLKGKDIIELKKMGTYLQVNIGSEKPKHVKKLMEKGEIDFYGSDAHGVKKRGYVDSYEIGLIKSTRGFSKREKEDRGNEKKHLNTGIFDTFFRSILQGAWSRGDS